MANRPRIYRDSTPTDFPQTNPFPASSNHDFTLQAVYEMRGSLGDLTAKVDRLINDVKGHGDKIDKVRMKLAWVAGGAAVAGFLLAIGLTLLKLLPAGLSPPGN